MELDKKSFSIRRHITLVLTLLVERAGMPELLAKLIVELLFFLLSWTVQRCLIFRRRTKAKKS